MDRPWLPENDLAYIAENGTDREKYLVGLITSLADEVEKLRWQLAWREVGL